MFTLRRYFFKFIIFVVFAGALFAIHFFSQLNDKIRLSTEEKLRELFPQLLVSLASAELLDSERVQCRGLVFYAPSRLGLKKRKILEVEEVLVHCPITIKDYWNRNISIESVELRHPHLILTRNTEGQINEWDLFQSRKSQGRGFALKIHQGTLEIDNQVIRDIDLHAFKETVSSNTTEEFANSGETMQDSEMVLQLYPLDSENSRGPSSILTENAGQFVPQKLEKSGAARHWSFRGAANTDCCRRILFQGTVDPKNKDWFLEGALEQLSFNDSFWGFADMLDWEDRFLKTKPGGAVKAEEIVKSLRGHCNTNFWVCKDDSAPMGFRGEIRGNLVEGRVHIGLFKHPFSQLRVQFHASEEELKIQHCSATYGDTRIFLSYRQPQLLSLEGAQLHLKTEQLMIDRDFIERLAKFFPWEVEKYTSKCTRFSVISDLETTLHRKSGRWVPHHFSLYGSDLNFVYADSLYPIDGLAGHLTLDRDENLEFRFAPPESGYSIPRFDLPFDLKSELDPTLPPSPSLRFLESLNYFPPELGNVLPSPESVHVQKDVPKNNQENENRIEICGRFENALHSAHGEITLKASTIPINAKLINTIPEKQRRVVQSLHPEGWISMSVSLEFPKDKSRPVEKHFVIGAENCSICYDLFPYPIRGINGIIEWNGDDWTFSNFTGDNESTKVQAKGFMKKRPEGLVLYLKIYATDLPLEGRLKEALKNPSHREIHHSLRGTGKVNVDAQVFYFPASKKLNVSFEAEPEKKQGLTIRPINFPLRIENVHGQIRFDNGDFTVKNMKGRSKDAKISSDVNCRFEKNGAWNMDISSIIVDQVQAKDTELLNAMPENLQVLIKNINPEGPINIAGAIHFSKTKTGAPLKTRWNATLTLFQNAANFGVPLNNIAGLVHLSGRTEDYQMKLFGDLELDSLFFNDVQLLNFRGPFRYDGERIFLGQNALGGTPSSSLASRGPVRYSGQAPEEFTFASLNQPGGDFQRGTNFSPLRSLQEEILESRNFGSGPSSNEFSQDAEFSGVPRPITANVFGGTAFCRGEVRVRQKNISYDLNLNLDNADLSHVVREWKSSSTASAPKKISGKLGVAARIRGEGRNLDTLSGEGSISLREAYLYETPMMIKLLQILSIREPRKSAFSSSDIFFRIQGKKAYLNPVRFQGDTFSLEGNGDVQLDGNRKISLILKTRLGNTKNRIPLLSDILGGAGEQLNEVHVEGSIDDPEIIRIPLPNVRKTIEQIQGT